MAVGDTTIDETTLTTDGTFHKVSGTIECDTNATTSAILGTGYWVTFDITNNQDDDDVVVPRVAKNASDFAATAANGSVHVQASAGAPDTFNWTGTYIA